MPRPIHRSEEDDVLKEREHEVGEGEELRYGRVGSGLYVRIRDFVSLPDLKLLVPHAVNCEFRVIKIEFFELRFIESMVSFQFVFVISENMVPAFGFLCGILVLVCARTGSNIAHDM